MKVFAKIRALCSLILLAAMSIRKTSGEADFGRPFSVVAGPRLRVSPRVLRDMVSHNWHGGFQKTQFPLPLVPVMVPMSCLPFILWSFARVD